MGNGKALTKEELGDIECIVAYYRNRLDKNKFNHPLMKEYNLNEMLLEAVVERYNQLKALNRVQDFEDLEDMLYKAYPTLPNVLNFIKSRYDYVFVDEFQDTSQLQYGILEPYFKSAEGFIAIGDDDQCIYGWRGSDIEIITKRFTTDYNPTIKHLTVNRRCPQEILNAVIPSIENNSNRHPKKLQASKTDGKIDIVVDGGIKYLSESIKEDLSKSERVGILGRTNADLLIPAMVLLLNNYTSFSVSKSVNLQSRIPSQVIGVMDLITQRYNNNFEGYFKLFTSKANAYQASKLCDVLSTSPDVSIYNLPMEDLEYSVPALFPLIRMLREEKEKDPVNAYITLLEVMEQEVYNGKTIYAQRARDFVYYIRKMIQEDNILKNKTIDELNMIFTSEIPKKLDERVIKRQKQEVDGKVKYYTPEDNSYVRITTVHDAKGKEWDNVYIWNDVDGCFPNSVGNRELSEEEFEEERRVHYIAWTRPKKKLTVFTRSDREPGFLGECDLTNAKVIKKNELLLTSLHTDKPPEKKSNGSKDITWVDYFKNYVIKFTSYDKICTVQGTNLDICMTKLGGSNGVISYLKDFQLEKYPINDLESVISDLLEQKALSYA